MAKVKNISTGPRGAWQGATLVMAEPGQVIEADDFCAEWFEKVAAAAPAPKPVPVATPAPAPAPKAKPAKAKPAAPKE